MVRLVVIGSLLGILAGCVARWDVGAGAVDIRKPDGVPVLNGGKSSETP